MPDDPIVGEETIIQEFLAPLAAGFPGAFGLKDDCAVIAPEPGCELVVKTDPVIAGLHFLPATDPADIAWKALAVNVSDLASKGAEPIAYLMALALPETPDRSWMQRFVTGLSEAQTEFGCHLIGGDTDRTRGPLTISITAFGSVRAGQMVRRGTARLGDQLFVTGTLGDAALGLQLVREHMLRSELGLSADEADELVRRYHRPQPRLDLRALLRRYASAAMDLSDGLAKDCGRMCATSGVGARISLSALPLSPPLLKAVSRRAELSQRVIGGGDDYEILFSVPQREAISFLVEAGAIDVRVTRVGEIISGSTVTFQDAAGNAVGFEKAGWDHFG
jgi:thiamine-monophosphate kinase